MGSTLTHKQAALVRELREIFELLALDFYNIKDYDKEQRTTRLGVIRNFVIRAGVIKQYVFVDELFNDELCDHFFGRKRSYPKLWNTKRFKNFNYHILEELSLMQKVRYVKVLRNVPRGISADIDRLNALRNGLAHVFFPENLRKSKPVWKGRVIFSLEGLKAFLNDMDEVNDFFVTARFGRY